MPEQSQEMEKHIEELAKRHGFSRDAVINMVEALGRFSGSMAQFNHPELGGSGQWMGGGMIMISDMFNDALKARVAALATDVAQLLASATSAGKPSQAVSMKIPPLSGSKREWWPANLGVPTSHGAQNRVRYAYFASARLLAIELDGKLTLYDTLDHQIGGFSQQQSRGGSLSFHSQHGLIDLADLPVVSQSE